MACLPREAVKIDAELAMSRLSFVVVACKGILQRDKGTRLEPGFCFWMFSADMRQD